MNWRFWHKHNFTYNDNIDPMTMGSYPAYRFCGCGLTEVMRSAWKGQVENSKGQIVDVSTPSIWVPIRRGAAIKYKA